MWSSPKKCRLTLEGLSLAARLYKAAVASCKVTAIPGLDPDLDILPPGLNTGGLNPGGGASPGGGVGGSQQRPGKQTGSAHAAAVARSGARGGTSVGGIAPGAGAAAGSSGFAEPWGGSGDLGSPLDLSPGPSAGSGASPTRSMRAAAERAASGAAAGPSGSSSAEGAGGRLLVVGGGPPPRARLPSDGARPAAAWSGDAIVISDSDSDADEPAPAAARAPAPAATRAAPPAALLGPGGSAGPGRPPLPPASAFAAPYLAHQAASGSQRDQQFPQPQLGGRGAAAPLGIQRALSTQASVTASLAPGG